MPNYKEQTIAGTSWTRSYRATCNNYPDNQSIWFDEEKVILSPDGTKFTSTEMGMGFGVTLNKDNSLNEFPILDINGDPTGKVATYQDVYLTLMSVYYHTAQIRDAEAANVQP